MDKQTIEKRRQTINAPYVPRDGDVLDPIRNRDNLEDRKLAIRRLGEQLTNLEQRSNLEARRARDLQRKMEQMQRRFRTKAEELIAQGKNPNAKVVHIKQGGAMPFDDQRWIGDWRSGIAFSEEQLIRDDLTLPVRDDQEIKILSTDIIWERTDSGDFSVSDWYVIGRKEVVDTGAAAYPENRLPTLTLSLRLPTYSSVNYLKVITISQVEIASVSYLDDDGVEQALSYTSDSSGSITDLRFKTVRTGNLILSIQQKTPIGSGPVKIRRSADYINERLRGAGFSQLLPSTEKEAEGFIFDLTVRSISTGLRTYEPIGFYRGTPIEISNPVGIRLESQSSAVGGTRPRGLCLVDKYIGLWLEDGSVLVDEVVPLPDYSPLQMEFLVGQEARLKFKPDFTKNLNMVEVESITLETVTLDASQTGTKYDHSSTAAEAGTYTTTTWGDLLYGDEQSVTLNVSDGGSSEAFLQTFVGSFTPSFSVEHIGLVDLMLDGYLPVQAPWWGKESQGHYERVVRNSLLFSATETSRALSGTQLSSVDVQVNPVSGLLTGVDGLPGIYLQHVTELGTRAQSLYSSAVSSASYTAPSDVVAAWGGSVGSRSAFAGYLSKGFTARIVYKDAGAMIPILHYGDLELTPFNSEGPVSSTYWTSRRRAAEGTDTLSDRGITAAQEITASEAVSTINNGYSADLYMFTTKTAHGFRPGDVVGIRGVKGWRGYYLVAYVESVTRFGITAPAFPTVDLSSRIVVFNAVEHKPPMKVFSGKELLKIGVDYVISLDSGGTWLGYFPTDGSWDRQRGETLIKFFRELKDCWAEYTILANQQISKRIQLKSGRLYFEKSLRKSSGVAAPIFVLRSDYAEVSLLSVKLISSDSTSKRSDSLLKTKTTRSQRNGR